MGYTYSNGITYVSGGTALSGTWRKLDNVQIFAQSSAKSPTSYFRTYALYVRVS
jgi:hypothetical protein